MTLLNSGGSPLTIAAIQLRSPAAKIPSASATLKPPKTLGSGTRLGISVPIESPLPAGPVKVIVTLRRSDRDEKRVLEGTLAKAVSIDPASLRGGQGLAQLTSVKLGPLTGGKVRLRVELAIANPRPQRLTLAGIDADLSISGSPFGKASAGALRLEPKEKRRVSLLVVASRATVSKTIRAMAGKAARFEVTGVLRLADGKQRIPFAATAGKEIFGKPNWSAITGQSAP